MSSALGVLWNTWDNFWQDTSISGVNNAGKARKSALRRIIWIVVFSLGLAGTIWALYTVYADYILYPVTTTITIQHKDKINYPSVTVCNQNRVDCGRLAELVTVCSENVTECITEAEFETMKSMLVDACSISSNGEGGGEGANEQQWNDQWNEWNDQDNSGSQNDNNQAGENTGNQAGTGSGNNQENSGTQQNNNESSNQDDISNDTENAESSENSNSQNQSDSADGIIKDESENNNSQNNSDSPNTDQDSTGNETGNTGISENNSSDGTDEETNSESTGESSNNNKTPQAQALIDGTAISEVSIPASSQVVSQGIARSNIMLKRRKRSPKGGEGKHAPDDKDLGYQPADVAAELNFLVKFMSLQTPNRIKIGHNFGSLVKSCTFRGRDCSNETNFFTINVPSYGNCFVFNTELNKQDAFGGARVTSLTGPAFGLTLILNLDQANYMKQGQSKQAGARMAVHPPDLNPLLDEEGMDLFPHTLTHASIQESDMQRIEAPYTSKCINYWDQTNYTAMAVMGPNSSEVVPYSLSQCQRLCVITKIDEKCNCFHPYYADFDFMIENATPCNLTSESTTYECVSKVVADIDQGIVYCGCPVECNETDYSVSLSSSLWPSNQYFLTAATAYGFPDAAQGDAKGEEDMKENLLSVIVYFQSLNIRNIEESIKYDIIAVIYAVGGSISLFLGISIAMIFEVFELMLDCLINLFFHCSGSQEKKKSPLLKV